MKQYKPVQRTALRIAMGKAYYRSQRYLKWLRMANQLATRRIAEPYEHRIAAHHTPLYRKLDQVDRSIQEAKIHNLRIAVKQLHGTVLEPGQVLSYWRLIGKPTAKKGYREGMILHYGKMQLGVGGGLCQLSNLLYWITLHSPLQVIERYRHSYDVFPDAQRTQPFGSGATCAYNYLDLMIHNPTDEPYQLWLTIGDQELHGEWRSTVPQRYTYEIVERNHRMTLEPWGGYMRHNELHRHTSTLDGAWLKEEYITENHALMMYAPLLAYTGSEQE